MTETEPVYLDAIAAEIGAIVPDCPRDLLLPYALLARVSGARTTLEHCHDARSAWLAAVTPDHPDVVPFSRLPDDVRQMDVPYRDAIRRVASRRALEEARNGA